MSNSFRLSLQKVNIAFMVYQINEVSIFFSEKQDNQNIANYNYEKFTNYVFKSLQ